MKIIEYKIIQSEQFTQVGVEKALIPESPKGFGWILQGFVILPHFGAYFLWWRINPFQIWNSHD